MLTTKKAVSRLQEKGRYRKKGGANGILGMYPAGTGIPMAFGKPMTMTVLYSCDRRWRAVYTTARM